MSQLQDIAISRVAPKVLDEAVTSVLEKENIITPRTRAGQALAACGLDIEDLAMHLANMIVNEKGSVKLRAIERGFQLHGVPLREEDQAVNTRPTVVFNIHSENTQLNQLFAPER